jgi:hypothetical protein
MRETFDYAFRSLADGGAGLDFITLTDYVTTSHWGEIGRYQKDYPGNLVARSAEVITYRGHTNNQVSVHYVDHRRGSYERVAGALTPDAAASAARALCRGAEERRLHADQPPDDLPAVEPRVRAPVPRLRVGLLARRDRLPLVDAIAFDRSRAHRRDGEPVHRDAIAFYEAALAAGNHIAAVGVSDSHKAAVPTRFETPVGQATTVVYASCPSAASGTRSAPGTPT